MAKKICPPFCDGRKSCPDHHSLLVAVVNCSDQRDSQRSNIEQFENAVEEMLKKGWKKEDDIPDPLKCYRFPLLHWAAVLGKCKAIEWLIKNGFSTTVRASETQETALHRCVQCLHYVGVRRLSQKIGALVELLKDCLPLQDKRSQTPLHASAGYLIKGNKSEFHQDCLEIMVAKAREMESQTSEILNARDITGNTVMHYLAQSEMGFAAICAIVHAGGNITIKNKENLTPLDVAVSSGATSIIKAFNNVGKIPHSLPQFEANMYGTDSPPESPSNKLDGDNREDDYGNNGDDLPGSENPDVVHPSVGSEFPTEDLPDEAVTESVGEPVNKDSVPTVVAAEVPVVATDKSSSDVIDREPLVTTSEVPATSSEDIPQKASQHTPSARLITSSRGVQTTGANSYSCVVHIKKEMLSLVAQSCDKCRYNSSGAISSSGCLSCSSNEVAGSMVALLKGAGLLSNLKELAEQTRAKDEQVLTEKLEQVKETNSSLETTETDIAERNEQIYEKLKEVEELKQQISSTMDEREQLFLKRKRLNDECNTLQKKLHCCDSLLKVVPQENLDG